jgi:hypothetical protein
MSFLQKRLVGKEFVNGLRVQALFYSSDIVLNELYILK